jgi:UDP-N-acetylmuramoyl-tripeptide--D-alanyl-D-alanine ligase
MLGLGFDTQYGVFEVGMNHPGEIARLSATLSPDWGLVTSVGPVHLEFFDSVASIAREKAELLRALPRTGLAFLHAGDPYYGILREAPNCPVRTLALGQEGDADLIVARDRGLLQIRERGDSGIVEIPAPAAGQHNVVNAGLAILVARTAGLSWDRIRQGLASFSPPPMRWEMQVLHGYTVINDAYNANPVSMSAALETFRETRTQGRKWLVLGDMLELGEHALQAHTELGRAVAQGGWAGIVAVGVHGKVVMDTAIASGFPSESICWTATPREAGDWLLPRLSRGDAILLKGSRGVQLERLLACIQEGAGK